MVVKVNGQWITAGGVEYWHGLDRQGGPPSRFASNWYYSPQVWGELASHQPAPGEQVGFFVTAGDQRAKDVRDRDRALERRAACRSRATAAAITRSREF